MKALVLAAGKGSRLGDAAQGVPKPLVDVAGRTPLGHVLSWVAELRPAQIWINVHEHAELVRARIGTDVHGVPIRYSYERELLGTGGAWKKLEAEWDETSLVVYGDNFMSFDLPALLAKHRAVARPVTMALFDPVRHANTGTAGGHASISGDRVLSFEEGGAHGLINAGAYVLEPQVRDWIPQGFSDFGRDVMPRLAAAGSVAAHVVEDGAYCLGIDTPARLATAREFVEGMMPQ